LLVSKTDFEYLSIQFTTLDLLILPQGSKKRNLLVLLTSAVNTIQLDLPNLRPQNARKQLWSDQASIQKATLSTEKRLDGKTKAWFWGLDALPFGDMIAVNFNILPTDVPVYLIPSDRRSFVVLSPTNPSHDDLQLSQPIEIDSMSGKIMN
jgi:hypothetical protein